MQLHLYLSPHLDDAVLSCGGLIDRQVRAGDRVVVLTVFAGDPPDKARSSFAERLADLWRTPQDPVGGRRAEDRAAMALLGASWVHWRYPDCIFRHDPQSGKALYPSRQAIFGEVHPSERTELVEELATELQAFCAEQRPDSVHSLLTAGHHVDHQLLQWASLRLADAGWSLRYYEDYPYVEEPARLEAALAEAGGKWQAEVEPLAPGNLRARLGAIACYRSQIGVLFTSEEAMRARVISYAESLGTDGLAERYWRPQGLSGAAG